MSKGIEKRLILLLLAIILLVSVSYLALKISVYVEGKWQFVQGEDLNTGQYNTDPYIVEILKKETYPEEYWNVVREGKLFFKPLPVQPLVEQTTVINETPEINIPVTVETPKVTCPLLNQGVTIGDPSLAILVNKETNGSEIVQVGSKVGEFQVVEIAVDYVLVSSSEGEFKLELGGI